MKAEEAERATGELLGSVKAPDFARESAFSFPAMEE